MYKSIQQRNVTCTYATSDFYREDVFLIDNQYLQLQYHCIVTLASPVVSWFKLLFKDVGCRDAGEVLELAAHRFTVISHFLYFSSVSVLRLCATCACRAPVPLSTGLCGRCCNSTRRLHVQKMGLVAVHWSLRFSLSANAMAAAGRWSTRSSSQYAH